MHTCLPAEDEYETATEESVCEILLEQTRTTFPFIRSAVCDLFGENCEESY